MSDLDALLEKNRAWAASMREQDPRFFSSLAEQQAPDHLWIGCADSRVPATQITDLAPGEIFVHRNIANVVVHTDVNALSVLQYAVEVLQVEHIIVCGHYGCGGVKAALHEERYGLIDNWLQHIRDVHRAHRDHVDGLPEDARHDRLCELNVAAQALNVARTTIVQDAWARGQKLDIHGLVYSLADGHLQELGPAMGRDSDVERTFQETVAQITEGRR